MYTTQELEDRRQAREEVANCDDYNRFLEYVNETDDSEILRVIIAHPLMSEETYEILWDKFMNRSYTFHYGLQNNRMAELLELPMRNPVELFVKYFDMLAEGCLNPYIEDPQGTSRFNYMDIAATAVILAIQKQDLEITMNADIEALLLDARVEGYGFKKAILTSKGILAKDIVSLADQGSWSAQHVAANYDLILPDEPEANKVFSYGISILRENGINTSSISREWMVRLLHWDWFEQCRVPVNDSIYN